MRIAILLFGLLVSTSTFSQDLDVSLDYSVTYEVPNSSKNSIDTLSLSYDRKGKYIYTDSQFIGESLAIEIFNTLANRTIDANILFQIEDNKALIDVRVDDNEIYLNMDMAAIIPQAVIDSDNTTELTQLISEKSPKTTTILGKEYTTYFLYPEGEPFNAMTLVVDEALPVNNNSIMKGFLTLLFNRPDTNIEVEFPNGLILMLADSSMTHLKAINVEATPSKFILTHKIQRS